MLIPKSLFTWTYQPTQREPSIFLVVSGLLVDDSAVGENVIKGFQALGSFLSETQLCVFPRGSSWIVNWTMQHTQTSLCKWCSTYAIHVHMHLFIVEKPPNCSRYLILVSDGRLWYTDECDCPPPWELQNSHRLRQTTPNGGRWATIENKFILVPFNSIQLCWFHPNRVQGLLFYNYLNNNNVIKIFISLDVFIYILYIYSDIALLIFFCQSERVLKIVFEQIKCIPPHVAPLTGNHRAFFFHLSQVRMTKTQQGFVRWEKPQQPEYVGQRYTSCFYFLFFTLPVCPLESAVSQYEPLFRGKSFDFLSNLSGMYQWWSIVYTSHLDLEKTRTLLKRNRCLSLILEPSVTWTPSSSSSSPFSLVRPRTNGLCSTDTQQGASSLGGEGRKECRWTTGTTRSRTSRDLVILFLITEVCETFIVTTLWQQRLFFLNSQRMLTLGCHSKCYLMENNGTDVLQVCSLCV